MRNNNLLKKSKITGWIKATLFCCLILVSVLPSQQVSAQCIETSQFGSATLSGSLSGSATIICNYAGEYGTWNGSVTGNTYTFTSSVATDFLTISTAPGGPGIAFGTQPLVWPATFTGTIYVHVSTNSGCGDQATCRDITGTTTALAPVTVLTPATGFNSIPCGQATTLCTHGGCGSPYLDNVDGYTVINAANSAVVNINGTYNTESGFDFVTIYSGSGTGGPIVFGPVSGSGPINFVGTPGQTYSVRFQSDVSFTLTGYNLAVTFTGSCLPPSLLVPFTGSNSNPCGTNVTLCSHNGCGVNYNANANGSTTLLSGGTAVININGTYDTEAGFDFITIYNGVGTGGTVLFGPVSGVGVINYTGLPGQILTVGFVSDVSFQSSGFNLAVSYTGLCALPCLISATATASPSAICPGGSSILTANASGNNGAVTYLWSTSETTQSINASSGGTYTVTVTDAIPAACSATATVVLTVNPSPAVTAGATPSTVPCNTPFQLTATPPPACIPNYTLSTIPFAPLTGTTVPGPSGDDNVVQFPIGFNFPFYCATYSQVYISTNGFISFDPDFSSGCCSGQALPNNSTFLDNMIAVCWTDLNVGGPGSIDLINLTSPNRLVIRYNDVAHCCGTTPAQVTAQIVLYESGVIEIHNTNIVALGTMTQGIENQNGTIATPVPGRNATSFSATNDAFRFTPQVTTTYAWSPTLNMNNPSLSNPTVSSISSTTTYTVTATNQFGCTATSTTTVNFNEVTASCSGTNNVCNGGTLGTASVTAGGGTPGYTYLWDNANTNSSISGLAAGTYCVTVTDAGGCTATCCYTVTEPSALIATAVATNSSCPLCPDGTVSINSVSGGTPGYTSTNLTGLLPGNYCITVTDANGCTTSACATVGAAGCTLAANGSQTTAVSCFGGSDGSATSNPTGGIIGPLTYAWSNGATTASISGLAAGNYTVVVSDLGSGCVDQSVVTITQPALLTATCSGNPVVLPGNLTVQIQGSGFQDEVTWNLRDASNVIILSGGPYGSGTNITVGPVPAVNGPFSLNMFAGTNFDDNDATFTVRCNGNIVATGCVRGQFGSGGCANVNSGVVTNISGCNTLVSTSGNVSCFGGSDGTADVTAGGGTPVYSYLWSNGSTTSSISGLPAGNYTVTITDANGCTATCVKLVTQPTPVTVTGVVTGVVCAESATGAINITPSGGTPSYTYLWSNGSTNEDQTGLATGSYTVTVTDANGCTASYSATVNCTDNLPPVLSVGPGSGTPLFENFEAGVLPGGWSATGLWHVTAACPSGTPPNPTKWAYYGQDGTCTFNNGGTNSGDLTSSTVAIPASASAAKVRFRYAYNGEGGVPPSGFDNASVKISVNGGAFVQAAPLSSTGSAGTWLASEFNINAAIGGTIALQWNFSTQDGIANDFLGLQVDSVAITYTNLQQCPNDIVVDNDPGVCGTNVTWTAPTATDNCAFVLTSNKNPGDFFPVGTTVVTYTATDGCGNTTSCSFNVTVNQVGPPILNISETHVEPSCNGGSNGSIDLTVSGGATPYAYNWSNGGTTEDLSGLTAGVYNVTVTEANGCSATFTVTVGEPAVLDALCGGSNVDCNGNSTGSASVTANGGTSPYSYLWSNAATSSNISGLPAGTYCVTVTDANGCTATCCYVVTEPAPLTTSSSQTNVSCFGGSDGSGTALPSGGTTPYTYLWSDGQTTATATGLIAGSYNVTVTDANGCVANTNLIITQPPQLTISETHVDVSCFGGGNGSIDLSLAGGTPGFSFLWSNGATTEDLINLTASTYFVTVTEGNGCTSAFSVVVTSPAKLIGNFVKVNPSCTAPGSINVTTIGGTPAYSWLWSNGATTEDISGLAAGTYTLVITDANGCTGSTTVVLNLNNTLSATTVINANATCGLSNGSATVTPSGGTAPYTFSWATVPVQTTATGTGLPSGVTIVTITDASGAGCILKKKVTVPVGTSGLGVKLTSPTFNGGKHISCNGASDGSATATPLYVPGPYTFIWSTGSTNQTITGLTAGTYTVTISNGGCTATGQITLTQPNPLVATATKVNPTCGSCNGTATAFQSGGTSPYTYLWSDGQTTKTATGLCAGTYICTVTDANGCTSSVAITLTNATAINISGVVTHLACNNINTGAITNTVTGGTAPYTYLWSTGHTTKNRTGLAAGTYTITVTDNKGCTAVATYTVNQPALMVLTATKTNVSCNGGNNGTATVTPAGGTPGYTYSWNTIPVQTNATATGLAAGTKICTVKDANNCSKSISVTINQPGALSVSTTQVNVNVNGGNNGSATATAAGGTSPYTYLWSTGSTNASISGLVAGVYTVTATDANGCTKAKTITITQPGPRIAGSDDSQLTKLNVYPNPGNGMINLNFESSIETPFNVSLFDMLGKIVYSKNFTTSNGSNNHKFDFTYLPKGVYVVKVELNNQHEIIRLVIQ